MTCSQFRDSIDLYVDGELAPAAAASAERHRRECPSCDRQAVRLLETKAAVRRTATEVPLPGDLEARVRAAIAPWWVAPAAGVRSAIVSRRGLAAAVLVLAALVAGLGLFRPLDTDAANAMDRLALRLDDSSPVVLEGTLLCRDCELEHRYGIKAPCNSIGHHGAIATADGRIWNLVEQQAATELIHNEALLGRRIVVHGRLFRGARALVVDRYELQG